MTLFFYYGSGDLGNRAVRLGDGFSFTESAESGTLAMSRIRIDDPLGELNIVGHHEFRVVDTGCSWQTLFKGYFADRGIKRQDSLLLGAARIWDATVYDINSTLQFEVFKHSDANRPAETDTARLAWLLSSGGIGPISTDDSAVFGAGVNLDKNDYRGMTAADVLSDCAQTSGNDYFVVWNEDLGAPQLHYYDPARAFFDSTLKISNVLDDVDESLVFCPDRDATLNRDPSRVYSGVYYRYGDGNAHVFRESTTVHDAIGHKRETSETDTTVNSKAKAEAKADKWLAEAETEEDKITVALFKVPPSKVNLIRAGMRIQVRFTHMPGYESFTWVRVTRRTVSQDGPTQLYYKLDLELTLYPKQGGSRVRHHSGAGSTPQQNPIANQPAETEIVSSDTAPWTELSPLGASLVFANGAGWGAENLAWPFTPCGVGAGAWLNPFAAGGYYAFTAPAAANQVAVRLPAFGPNATHGNAVSWVVGIVNTATPDLAQVGAVVASAGAQLVDVQIPAGLIPWGGDFSIVVWPAWAVDTRGYVCALAGGQRPEQTGQLGCGEFSGFPSTLSIDYMAVVDGTTGWIDAAPFEAPDGATQTFTLVSWDGTDRPTVTRNGVKVELAGIDSTNRQVTLNEVPETGDVVIARYHVGDSPE